MSKDIDKLLEIPDFLRRTNVDMSKQTDIEKEDQRIWIWNPSPYYALKKKREERKQEILEEKKAKQKRKQLKIKTEGLILELIEDNYNTFYKIKNCLKENYYPHKENEIRNALKRLINKNKVIKVTKKIYATNFK